MLLWPDRGDEIEPAIVVTGSLNLSAGSSVA
jgi:hypothetical protein